MIDETGNTFTVVLSYFRGKVRVSKQTRIINSASVMEMEFARFSALNPVTQNRHRVLMEFRKSFVYEECEFRAFMAKSLKKKQL